MPAIKTLGKLTVGASAVQLTTTNTLVSSVTISADEDNTGKIYVGDSTVTTDNYAVKLLGDDTVTIHAPAGGVMNLRDIWLVASAASQAIQAGYVQVG